MIDCKDMDGGSFRDPSGCVFWHEGRVYRRVNACYAENYVRLMESGLYGRLVDAGLMIPFRESDDSWTWDGAPPYRVLVPEQVEFITYPYEWCFSAYRDAALATLAIQDHALSHGMILKDASAFNMQFHRGRPVLIDSLSFERYEPGKLWVAYRQFCEQFLGPLALMSCAGHEWGGILKHQLDGVSLRRVTKLLPLRALLRPSLFIHLYLHGLFQVGASGGAVKRDRRLAVSEGSLRGLTASLRSAVQGLRAPRGRSHWADYYATFGYDQAAFERKKKFVAECLGGSKVGTVWDLGCNTGEFTAIAAAAGAQVIAMDQDPDCVEALYARRGGDRDRILPILMDVCNPSPSLGLGGAERKSLCERGPADWVLCLALVHHLCLGRNVPLDRLAYELRRMGRRLIIEFVPKSDSQAQRLLASREDVFGLYTQAGFEDAFGQFFVITRRQGEDGGRILYQMEGRA